MDYTHFIFMFLTIAVVIVFVSFVVACVSSSGIVERTERDIEEEHNNKTEDNQWQIKRHIR